MAGQSCYVPGDTVFCNVWVLVYNADHIFGDGPLGANYLRMYLTDLYKIFRIGTVKVLIWVGMINPTFFSRSFKGLCY